jgi:hypothetical protein
MSPQSSIAHYRITAKPAEGGISDFEVGKARYRDPNVSARSVDSVASASVDNRLPRWLNREAGIAEAVIEWS